MAFAKEPVVTGDIDCRRLELLNLESHMIFSYSMEARFLQFTGHGIVANHASSDQVRGYQQVLNLLLVLVLPYK